MWRDFQWRVEAQRWQILLSWLIFIQLSGKIYYPELSVSGKFYYPCIPMCNDDIIAIMISQTIEDVQGHGHFCGWETFWIVVRLYVVTAWLTTAVPRFQWSWIEVITGKDRQISLCSLCVERALQPNSYHETLFRHERNTQDFW